MKNLSETEKLFFQLLLSALCKHKKEKNMINLLKKSIKLLFTLSIAAVMLVGCVLMPDESADGGYGSTSLSENTSSADIASESSEADTASEPYSPDQSGDLFADYYALAEKMLNEMTLEEKVGQMFLARFPQSGVIEEIQGFGPSGYILFGVDFRDETKDSLIEKLRYCQASSKIKMIFGVDEEGGTVARVSAYPAFRKSRFLSPQQLWAKGGMNAILEDSAEKSALLADLGLNMNLAPVADVPTDPASFIYDRSYGRSAEETAEYVSQVVEAMNGDGMISVMKHFPGYGDNEDTHTGVAIDERPYDAFTSADFLPFIGGIKAGAPCILVNHNIVKSMDADKPASLSKNVHDILRDELDFTGIIMTDDLAMDAVKPYAENGEASVLAILAGNDMIISSDFQAQFQEVLNAVKQERIPEAQIDESVKRILAMKYMYNILQ